MSSCAEPGWSGTGFVHEACLFSDDQAMAERCVPFIREGLKEGQPVLTLLAPGTAAALTAALGDDAARLTALGVAPNWWLGGHRTLITWDGLLRPMAAAGSPWRVVAEPVWLADAAGASWHRFEAAVNECYADFPLYAICLHDRRGLPEGVLATACRTHPLLSEGAAVRRSPEFVEPRRFVAAAEPAWFPPPADACVERVLTTRDGRVFAEAAARRAGFDSSDEVVLAVHELVTNALQASHAATLTAWCADANLLVEVSNEGEAMVDPLAGYTPPTGSSESGRGMWLAWALSDDATLHTGPTGISVRLAFSLSGRRPTPRR